MVCKNDGFEDVFYSAFSLIYVGYCAKLSAAFEVPNSVRVGKWIGGIFSLESRITIYAGFIYLSASNSSYSPTGGCGILCSHCLLKVNEPWIF
jgi:hypothetical protein